VKNRRKKPGVRPDKPPKKPAAKGGGKKAVVKTIHLMQASMQFSDSIAQLERDLDYALSQGADVVGFTEITSDQWKQILRAKARAHGYAPVIAPKSNVNLAVKLGGDAQTGLKGQGAIKAADGVGGAYHGRYVAWARITWWGQNIYVHEAHWSRLKHGDRRHTDVTNQMAAQVKKHGQGNAISFFMGDVNISEGADNRNNERNMPNFIFRENGLLTIWDEFQVLPPPTLGGAVFDVVGSFRPDKQVVGKRYVVHPKQRSDHSFVSAWYDVDVSERVTAAGGGGDGGPVGTISNPSGDAETPTAPKAYSDYWLPGSGVIDWSDYLDDDLYELPYAYGDSDSHRHG
jgi:hypothetical protein